MIWKCLPLRMLKVFFIAFELLMCNGLSDIQLHFPKRRNLDLSWDCSDIGVTAKLEQGALLLENE